MSISVAYKCPSVCFLMVIKYSFEEARDALSERRAGERERSVARPLLVGDCWSSRWVDGRWCWDLRCHVPAPFSGLTSRSVFPPPPPPLTSQVMFWPITSLTPSTLVSSPLEPWPGRHLPWSIWEELFGKWRRRKMKCVLFYKSYFKKVLEIKVEFWLWNAEIMHYRIFRGRMSSNAVNIVYF